MMPPFEPEPSDYFHEERARRYRYPWYIRGRQRLAGLLAAVAYYLGYDLSAWQLQANPQTAKGQGMLFTFIRALYGLFADTKFAQHWASHRDVLPRGTYLYYKDNEDPIAQAEKLYTTCLANGSLGQLPPVVDVEGINNATLTASKIRLCVERVDELFGDVMIYTAYYVWRDEVSGDKSWAAAHKLWIAGYPFADWKPEYFELVKNYPPLIPAPWNTFQVWQFTSKLPAAQYGVSGTYLDGNYCSEAFAVAYLNFSPPPPPDPQEAPPMQFKTKTQYKIRSSPATTSNNHIGWIPANTVIVAKEVRFTDSNSSWVRIVPDPAWLITPNYTGEAWIAGNHDGQGPFLDFVQS